MRTRPPEANLQILRERGVEIVEPGVGRLASKGEEGVGRLAEPARLLEVCETVLAADRRARHAGGPLIGGAGDAPAGAD